MRKALILKLKSRAMAAVAATGALLVAVAMPGAALAACGDDYNLDYHASLGKLDICNIEHELPEAVTILTNWGARPVWVDNTSFVFLNNMVGDVYMMDIGSNTVRLLTGHFAHAGFTRAQPLPNGDLLLVGPSSGPQPPMEPLELYERGRFEGDMFVLKKPFNGQPVPLGVHAWEGVAVSRKSNRIAWSDTDKPFFGSNLIETGLNYLLGRSNLWVGELVYDRSGKPSLVNRRIVKRKFGLVFYEPQDFRGHWDQELLYSAYGPGAEGSSDTYVYNFFWNWSWKKPWYSWGYNEWEGVSPDFKRAFIERDPEATEFSGPGHIDAWLWDFASGKPIPFAQFRRADNFSLGNAVFSPDGRYVLMSADASLGDAPDAPGYSVGIALIDYKGWLANPQVLR